MHWNTEILHIICHTIYTIITYMYIRTVHMYVLYCASYII